MFQSSAQYLSLFLMGSAAVYAQSSLAQNVVSQVCDDGSIGASVSLAAFPDYLGDPPDLIYDFVNFQDLSFVNSQFKDSVSSCLTEVSSLAFPEIDTSSTGFLGLNRLYKSLNTPDPDRANWVNLEGLNQKLEGFKYQLEQVDPSKFKDMGSESIDWTLHLDNAQADLNRLSYAIEEAQCKVCESSDTSMLEKPDSVNFLRFFNNIKQNERADDRIVLHVLGDLFGKYSDLEGAQRADMGAYLLDMVESGLIDSELKSEDLSGTLKLELQKNLERSLKLERLIKEDLLGFAQSFKETVIGLQEGQSILLYGGWQNKKGGHALLYEVSKGPLERIDFKIYNTGDGTKNFHQSLTLGNSKFLFATKEIIGVNQDKLTQHAFLQTLFKLRNEINDDWNAHILYDAILPELGGEVVVKEHSTSELYNPQVSGTCTYQVLSAYLHSLFSDKSLFHRAAFKIKFKTLIDYLENHSPDEFIHDEQRRKLTEKSVVYLSREAIDLRHNDILEKDEFEQVSNFLSRIKLDMQLAEAKSDRIHRSDLVRSNYTLNSSLDRGYTSIFRKDDSFKKITDLQLSTPTYVRTFTRDLPLTEENFVEEFSLLHSHVEEIRLNMEYDRAQASVREITKRLSFSKKTKEGQIQVQSVVDSLNKSELIDVLAQLKDLAYSNYSPIYQHVQEKDSYSYEVCHDPELNPSVALSQLKLTVFADLAFQRLLKISNLNSKSLISEDLKHILNGKNVYFLLYCPEQSEEFIELIDHFQGKENAIPLFEHEADVRYPTNGGELGNVELFQWDYIKSSEFKQKFHDSFNRFNPFNRGLSDLSLEDKAKSMFCDRGPYASVMPSWYYSARDLSLLSSFMLRSIEGQDYRSIDVTNIYEIPSELKTSYKKWDKTKYPDSIVQLKGDRIFPILFEEFELKHNPARQHAFLEHHKRMPKTTGLVELGDQGGLIGVRSEEALHCGAQNVIKKLVADDAKPSLFEPLGSSKIDYQDYRAFASIFLNPKLQLINTLGYFQRNIFLLRERSMQGAFEYLLYGKRNLLDELCSPNGDGNLLIEGYSQLFEIGIELSTKLSDPGLLIFFTENMLRFNQYVSYAAQKNPIVKQIPSDLTEVQSVLKEAIAKVPLEKSQMKSLLILDSMASLRKADIDNQAWLNILSNHFKLEYLAGNTDEEKLLLKCRFTEKTNKYSSGSFIEKTEDALINWESGTKGLEFNYLEVLFEKLESFEKTEDMGKLNPILNQLLFLNNRVLDREDQSWHRLSPYVYQNENEKYIIDLKRAKVTKSGEELAQIHTHRISKILQELKVDFKKSKILKSPHSYEILLENGVRFKAFVSSTRHGKVEIGVPLQIFHKDKWYQFDSKLNSKAMEVLYKSIEDKEVEAPLEMPDNLGDFLEKYELPIPAILFDRPDLSFAFSEDWSEIIGFSKNSHRVEYKLNLGRQARSTTDSQPVILEKLSPVTGVATHHKVHHDDEALLGWRYIYNLEEKANILMWKSVQSGTLDIIEIPKYHLKFHKKEMGGDLRLVCAQEPGFFISSNQYVENMGNFAGFLVLENQAGIRKVLIPSENFYSGDKGTSLITEKIYKETKESSSYSFLPLTETNDINIGGLSPVQKLRLATIYLAEHRYQKAEDFLLSITSSSLEPYTSAEANQLANIILLDKSSDQRALYIKVKALLALIKNFLDFKMSFFPSILTLARKFDLELSGNENDEIMRVIQEYLSTYDNSHSPYLEWEELDLLHELINHETIKSYGLLLDNQAKINDEAKITEAELIGQVSLHQARNLTDGDVIKDSKKLQEIFSDMSSKFKDETFTSRLSLPEPNQANNVEITCPILKSFEGLESLVSLFSLITNHNDLLSNKLELANNLLGLKLNEDISLKEFQDELKTYFRLMMRTLEVNGKQSHSITPNKWLIYALNAMINQPEQFPPYEELIQLYTERNFAIASEKNFVSEFLCSYIYDYCTPTPTTSGPLNRMNSTLVGAINNAAINYYQNSLTDKASPEKGESSSETHLQCFAKVLKDLKEEYALPLPDALNKTEATLHIPLLDEELMTSSNHSESTSLSLNLTEGKNHLEKAEVEALQNVIQSYQQTNQIVSNRPFNLTHTINFQKQLSEKMHSEARSFKETRIELLHLANKLPTLPDEIAEREAEVAAGYYRPIDIKDLKLIFLEGDFEAYTRLNSALSYEDAVELQNKIKLYLVQSTYLTHLQRSNGALLNYIDFIQKGGDPDKEPKVFNDVRTTLSLTRAYSLEDHPEMLVFEEELGIILRKDQVKNIEKLTQKDGPNQVLEMVVGAGKTFVLSPLIAKHNADGEQLSIMIMPEELFPSMSKEIEASLSGTFETYVQSFKFDRNQRITTSNLKWIHKQIRGVIENKKVLMMTPRSIQSFYLLAVEALYQYENEQNQNLKNGLKEKIEEFGAILQIFKDSGNLLIDEIDLVLHPLKEHHFTYKSTLPNPEVLGDISSLYAILAKEFPELLDLYSNEGARVFSKKQYFEDYKPAIIEKILHGSYSQNDKDLSTYLSDPENLRIARDFLANIHNSSELHKANKRVKDRLAIAKEMVDSLLPLTLSKSAEEHFGRSKEEPQLQTMIPYHGSNHPAEGSRFGTFYESTCYTYQYYLKKGISKEQLRVVLSKWQEKLSQQITETKSGMKFNFSATQSSKALGRLSSKLVDIKYLTQLDQNLDEALHIINKDPVAQLSFVEEYILPELEVNENHIRVGPELYNWLFKKVNGFTGTLWNPEAFSEGIELHPSTKATGKIITLLMKDSSKDIQLIPSTKSLKELTFSLINQRNEQGVQAIIDAGAYYKGYSGLEVAHSILDREVLQKRELPIRGVVFYDDADQLKILSLLNGKREVRNYHGGEFKNEELITFYDQKHTTGSNIPQSLEATGVVTVGPNMKLRDLIQASGRMRKLAEGQRIRFALNEGVLNLVKENSKQTGLSLDGLIDFAMRNQIAEKVRNNYRALKSKLNSAIEFSVMEQVLLGDLPLEQSQALLTEFKSLFVLEEKIAPFKQFQFSGEEMDTETLIRSAIDAFEVKAKKLQEYGIVIQGFSTREERQALYDKHLKILPPKLVERKGNYEFEMQVETDTQKEKETQNEVDVEKETAFEYRDDLCAELPRSYFNFNPASSLVKGKELFPISPVNSSDPFPVDPVLPLIPVDSLVQSFLGDKFDFFETSLMASKGILPYNIYDPFAFQMRIPKHALILQDKGSQDIKFVMLDDATASTIKTAALQDLVPDGSDYKLALYHPEINTFSRSTEDPSKILSSDEAKENPKFELLNVQMKFFKGDVAYSKKELDALDQLLLTKADDISKKNGKTLAEALKQVKMDARELFELITATKDTSRSLYKGSPIYEYFAS